MKKLAGLVLLLSCLGASISSGATTKDPSVYIPLREEMTALETGFMQLEILAASKPLDRAGVGQTLEKMKGSTKKIIKVNKNASLDESLKVLSKRLEALQKDAKQQDNAVIRNHLDLLYQGCFRCHETHAPRMK